ncbi:cupredoxin domain-containing protein [Candidatus Uhrbacteria bacterium]|nr:cupredoxin domain-containing protein [Candidatus Uhrbacteria bacterium]
MSHFKKTAVGLSVVALLAGSVALAATTKAPVKAPAKPAPKVVVKKPVVKPAPVKKPVVPAKAPAKAPVQNTPKPAAKPETKPEAKIPTPPPVKADVAVAPKPATWNVEIKNFQFNPSNLKIKAGDTVIWTNADGAPHQIDSNPHPIHTDHPELNGSMMSTGQTFTVTLKNAGTYNYHCHLHPSMQGSVTVE